jgi:hypothetical protein
MATPEEQTLIGDDCDLYTGKAAATALVGDGTKTLDVLSGGTAGDKSGAGFYIIAAKAASGSIFPAGLSVGDMYPALGTELMVVGDTCKKLDLTKRGDASGWSLEITRSKIETTLLKHKFKKYRYGKKDATGKISSIFTMGITDQAAGHIGQTMTLFTRTGSTVTVTVPEDESIYLLGYIRKGSVSGEFEDYVFAQINLSNVTLGGSSGSAQSYDSEFSLTGNDPLFYSVEIPAA